MTRQSRATSQSDEFLEELRFRIRGLREDESGQSIVYLVLMMFLLACFTFMVINSGALLHDKLQVQSASDSAVLSGSTWIARGMNLNSMMNILMAMCFAQWIYMEAVYATAVAAMLQFSVIGFWGGVCLTTGNCEPALSAPFEFPALFGASSAANSNADFMEDVLETLTDIEAGVDATLPFVAEAEAMRMANINGATLGIMYPPEIPEEEGHLDDLCDTLEDGSDGGYDEFEYTGFGGYGAALGMISGFSYSWDQLAFASALSAPHLGKEGPLWGEMQMPYQSFWAGEAPYHFTNVMFIMAVQSKHAVMCGGTWPVPTIPYVIPAAWWCFLCPSNVYDIVNPYNSLGAVFAGLGGGMPGVKPMLLADDFETARNFYGFAYKDPADVQAKFLPDFFENTYGDSVGMLTVAQAQIYNPHIGGGMFSPHWRTHLAPVELDEAVTENAATYLLSTSFGSTGANPASVGGLLSVIESITGGGIEDLFAH